MARPSDREFSRSKLPREIDAMHRLFPRLARKILPLILPAVVLCSCIGCDQWTKSLATLHLRQAPAMSFLGDMLRIQYAENAGAFLGAGARLPASTRFAILVVVNALFLGLIAGLL